MELPCHQQTTINISSQAIHIYHVFTDEMISQDLNFHITYDASNVVQTF
jgi:hypothetical protein